MIRDVLLAQKQELKGRLKESYIQRKADPEKLSNSLIKVIIGPRRAGKSFFALHFLNKQGSFGYVNFDDEQLMDMKSYDEIIETVNSLYDSPKYILLDEIQNIPKWELLANRLQRKGTNLIITGSNSHLLSKEFATHLTGRHLSIVILPFSFKEFLEIGKKELTTQQIQEKLDIYLVNGGYPEPLLKDMSYKDYLSTLFDSIIYKDIAKRYKIRFIKGIEDLSYYLMSNLASEYSYTNLSKMVKIQSVHTIQKYLGYLEETFIFFSVPRFSNKAKEQITFNKKIYCVDNGFIQAKAFKVSPDYGILYENVVAQELKKDELNNKIRLYYWKNQQQEEVDFVVHERNKVTQLIQVCYDVSKSKTRQREIRTLLKAGHELKCSNLLLITHDHEGTMKEEWFDMKGTIICIPLWKWLLQRGG